MFSAARSSLVAALAVTGLVAQGGDALWEAFRNPPVEARPFVRWWWNGNRIDAGEIRRQLGSMADAGIGGVEINPIALAAEARALDIDAVPWLSAEWNRLLRVAADEARGHGMLADLIVGSGWPFGGRFLEPDEQIQILRVRTVPIPAGEALRLRIDELLDFPKGRRGDDFVDDPATELEFLQLVPLSCDAVDDVVDVTQRVAAGALTVAPADVERRLFVGAVQIGFRRVVHGAPGADGPVLDHFDRQAVEKYLARMSESLAPALGGRLGDRLRAMFCDSIELGGADWTEDLPVEFAARRGYELRPWLPFVASASAGRPFGHLAAGIELADDFADQVRRVRHDYAQTLCELLEERFIRPFHEWCHEQGTQSRYQAYGHPWLYGMLDGYLVPDIPEGDLWIHFPQDSVGQRLDGIRYAVWNKYASSAAHINGRRLVSCEAITNLHGVFRATLEDLKQAADLDFMTGVNHSVLHGFNHSPVAAGIPGWIRYGTWLSPHNPWWPHFRLFSDYHARVAAVLQATTPVAQVAILGPRADVLADHGLERTRHIRQPAYLHELWQAFSQNGTTADYLSARVLGAARCEGGRLICGQMGYSLLVVVEVESLDVDAAKAIQRFVAAGGRVAFVGSVPSRAPSLTDRRAEDARVQLAMQRTVDAGDPRVAVVPAPGDAALIDWVGELLGRFVVTRSVRFGRPDPRLFQVHHRAGDRDLLFVANLDREREIATPFALGGARRSVEFWDPATGARRPASLQPEGFSELRLGPLESTFVVVGSGPATLAIEESAPPRVVDRLQGPWSVRFEPMVGEPFTRELDELVDLGRAEDERLQTFAGVSTYRTTVDVGSLRGARLLDLGTVHGVSEVLLGDRTLGRRWFGRHRYELPRLEGNAVPLTVRVTTTAANYLRTLEDPTSRRWTRAWRDEEPVKAGLVGPVELLR